MNERHAPLIVKQLFKQFKAKSWPWQSKQRPFVAVDHISFQLGAGEILGLLGANGAGKTTTIQMLLGTMTPTGGSIEYFGKDFFTHRSEIMQRVSFASTYVRLPGRLSMYENLDFYAKLFGISASQRQARLENYLKFFDLWHLKDRKASALSAGETTRAILVKAFLPNPDVVLLDEPTASLDPDIAHEVRKFVLQQRKERNIAILFTSHNMDEVADVCDRVLVMKQGKIIADDTPHNLAASVSSARVRLMAIQDLERIKQYVQQKGYIFHVDERSILIDVDEQKIAQLLADLTRNNLTYEYVSIEKPTLEDYFLSITQRRTGRAL